MKLFFKYINVIVLIVFALIFGFELLLRQIPNDYSVKANYLKKHGNEIETLILGSSHTFYGINPNLIPNSYNLAHSSKSYDLDWKILEKNEKYLTQLKTIILSSSYFSFVHIVENSTQKDLLKYYAIYYKINTNSINLKTNTEIFNLPLSENINRLKDYNTKSKDYITIDNKGYILKRRKQDLDKYYSTETVKKHTLPFDSFVVNKNINGLKHILKFAKERKINVIFVTTPVSPNYFKNVNRQQFLHWTKTTNNFIKASPSFIWINYFNQPEKFEKADFIDADHLSLKGANKITQEVLKYIK